MFTGKIVQDVPRKASVLEVKRNGGAFQPFHRDEGVGKPTNKASSGKSVSPSPAPVPATIFSAGGNAKKSEEKDGQRKQRRCWSPELHKRFLQALQQLGGPDCECFRLIYLYSFLYFDLSNLYILLAKKLIFFLNWYGVC